MANKKRMIYKSQKLTAYGVYSTMSIFGSPVRELLHVEFDYISAKDFAKEYHLEHPSLKLMIENVEVKLNAWDGVISDKAIVENLY